jgi:phosphatidylinositol 3-kinase
MYVLMKIHCVLCADNAIPGSWNERITLPIRYRDLPLSSQIIFTIYDYGGPPAISAAVPAGGTTLRLFGKKNTLKKGKQRMLLWPDREADASIESSTPSKVTGQDKDERGRLEKVRKLSFAAFACRACRS